MKRKKSRKRHDSEWSDDDMPIGKLTPVKNFLPPPSELFTPDGKIKVTITLSRSSIAFFKAYAKKHNIKYQKLIREVIDRYSKYYGPNA